MRQRQVQLHIGPVEGAEGAEACDVAVLWIPESQARLDLREEAVPKALDEQR